MLFNRERSNAIKTANFQLSVITIYECNWLKVTLSNDYFDGVQSSQLLVPSIATFLAGKIVYPNILKGQEEQEKVRKCCFNRSMRTNFYYRILQHYFKIQFKN